MHLTLIQALLLGLLQGVAELFPISSLAQTILIPRLCGWDVGDPKSPEHGDFLAFVVALHLATAVALVIYYRKEWIRVVKAFLGCIPHGKLVYDRDSKFAWMLVAGTVVVGAAGLVGQKKISELFEQPALAWVVAEILIVNGFFMIFGDVVKRRAAKKNPTEPEHVTATGADAALHAAFIGRPLNADLAAGASDSTPRYAKRAEDMSFTEAAAVGAAQTAALLPGISRSGVTIVGGLFAGLTYEEATRFSFMLATPVIGLAAILKVPKLIKPGPEINTPELLADFHRAQHLALYASGVAFVAAYLSVKFLVRYFHTNRLSPFGYFCIAFGLFAAIKLKMYP